MNVQDFASISASLKEIEDRFTRPTQVYPTLAAGVTATGAAGAWTLGAKVEIVPASTITNAFHITGLGIEALSVVDSYQLEVYYGAGDTLAGTARFSRTATQDSPQYIPFTTLEIPANSRVRCAIASASGGSDTAKISIAYSEHA